MNLAQWCVRGPVRRTLPRLEIIESRDHIREEARALAGRVAELEARRRTIEARMALMRTREIVSLHPQAAARYQQKVAEIHDALSRGDAASAEAVALVREMITEIRITPRGKGQPVGIEIVGDLAALMATERDEHAVTVSMVAGAGFEPATFRL